MNILGTKSKFVLLELHHPSMRLYTHSLVIIRIVMRKTKRVNVISFRIRFPVAVVIDMGTHRAHITARV